MDVAECERRDGGVADAGAVVGYRLQPVGDAEATALLPLERVLGLGDPGSRCPMTRTRDEERSPRSAAQPQWIHRIHRVVPGVGVGLPGLVDQRIDAQELSGPRVVVAPY